MSETNSSILTRSVKISKRGRQEDTTVHSFDGRGDLTIRLGVEANAPNTMASVVADVAMTSVMLAVSVTALEVGILLSSGVAMTALVGLVALVTTVLCPATMSA